MSKPPYPYDPVTGTILLPDSIKEELRRMIARGEKIEAMKRVLELTGAGLKISKDYVDGLAKR
jgi:ribosomal protein L7/L12